MSVTQETAYLIETLARAASQIGSTAASAKINQLIVDILPATSVGSTEDALRQENEALQLELTSLQKSAGIMAENLALLRERMEQINTIAFGLLETAPADDDGEALQQILTLSTPAAGPVEA
jgi:chaperonin cofactor prefoldin